MAGVLSLGFLWAAVATSGVLASMTANAIEDKDWSNASTYSISNAIIGALTALMFMVILFKTGVLSGTSVSIDLGILLMITVMIGNAILSSLAAVHIKHRDSAAMSYCVGTATMNFAAVLLVPAIIFASSRDVNSSVSKAKAPARE